MRKMWKTKTLNKQATKKLIHQCKYKKFTNFEFKANSRTVSFNNKKIPRPRKSRFEVKANTNIPKK